MTKRAEYAVYKGDDYLGSGTAKELADKFDVDIKTIYWWSTPTSIKRGKGNRKVVVRIDV